MLDPLGFFRTGKHVTDADLLFGQIADPHIRAQRNYLLVCAICRGALVVVAVSVLAVGLWQLAPVLFNAIPAMIEGAQVEVGRG